MQKLFDSLEKHRIIIGSVIGVALLGVGALLVWIDWHPPTTQVVTTKRTTSSSQPSAQAASLQSTAATSLKTAHAVSGNTVQGVVNINTASAAELDSLPGIGQTYAARIVDYRAKHGRFLTTHDIVKVQGIGEGIYSKIKAKITAGE